MTDASTPRDTPAVTAPEPAPVPETAPTCEPPAGQPTDPPSPGGPGRAGPPAPLDEALVRALEADFAKDGAEAIKKMRAEKPTDYVKIIAALCAKQSTDPTNSLREMSDAELDRAIHDIAPRAGFEIRALAAPRRGGEAGDGGTAAG